VKNEKKMDWFLNDRFGMIIHWGISAVWGRGEKVIGYDKISNEEYRETFENFNPQNFDASKWAKIAKNAGMKYAVLIAKHHDGFCLFDSKYTNYKVTNTLLGRDVVKEFLEAFRNEGLKVGLYYSVIDWYHPDYPAFGDEYAPMRDNLAYKELEKEKDFDRYLEYMHSQVEELCTNYGKLDLMWFDYSYGNMRGEKWRATELVNMIRKYQPDIILNNRLEVSGDGYGSIITENPTVFCGDFVTPEQIIPHEGIRNYKNEMVPWECCLTMNNHWGYFYGDDNFKSAETIIRKLVECVSKGGNMILNVGPNANGEIPDKSISILNQIGEWLRVNSESIYGCGCSGLEKPDYGRITKKANNYYYHIFETVIGPVALHGLCKEKIESI